MRYEFENNSSVVIDSGNPTEISSDIEVAGSAGTVRDVNVTIDVTHTWTADLKISLEGPGGQRVLLVGGKGGSGDDFRQTKFDDAGLMSISSGIPPFHGTFMPEESLSAFNNSDPNGRWTLHAEDLAYQDGGSLNYWLLSIETSENEYRNESPVVIDPGPPSIVTSTIEVSGMGGMVVDDLNVTVDIDHTWVGDLTIALINQANQRVVLVEKEGGSADDFRNTTFDDEADQSITESSAPFSGSFRPEGNISDFYDKIADGIWTLEVNDNAQHDGGVLNYWSMDMTVKSPEPVIESEFNIEIRFMGGLTASQRSVFEFAAARWSEIIVGDIPSIEINGEVIDDVLIYARGVSIDGRGNTLGMAGPEYIRYGTYLPATGVMSFDTADLASMEADGSLLHVITHEMGHVLGIGTVWKYHEYLQGEGSINPTFVGPMAMQEYGTLTGENISEPIPVANTGGTGTRDAHWREDVFGNELMTGFIDSGMNPLSRMTIASLEDIGYEVNYNAADPYILPGARVLAEMGVGAARADHGDHGYMFFPDQIVLPPSAYIDQ
jgi:subtilisin-like proprotein convertase family protein